MRAHTLYQLVSTENKYFRVGTHKSINNCVTLEQALQPRLHSWNDLSTNRRIIHSP